MGPVIAGAQQDGEIGFVMTFAKEGVVFLSLSLMLTSCDCRPGE